MFYEDRCQFFIFYFTLYQFLKETVIVFFLRLLFMQFCMTSFSLTRIFLVACVNRKTRQATSKFKKLPRVN